MPNNSHVCAQKLLLNCGPRSDIRVAGSPCNLTTLFTNKAAKLLAFKDSVVGTNCTILLSLSTNTKRLLPSFR